MKVLEASESQQRIYERLARLDEETQERISRKYYHGTRPWLKAKGGEGARRKRRETAKNAE